MNGVADSRLHGTRVVDHLRCLQPRCADRQQQGLDRLAGDREGVARVKELAVDSESDVRYQWHVRMDRSVILAVDVHVEARGSERVPMTHGVHPGAEVSELRGYRRAGPQLEPGVALQRCPHDPGVEVVGMLVRDQDGVRSGQRILAAPYTWIEHDRLAVAFQPDAGMPELRHPHGCSRSLTGALDRNLSRPLPGCRDAIPPTVTPSR